MVVASRLVGLGGTPLLGALQTTEPVLERLDPQRRVAVVMALVALTLVGLFLVTFAMIGGHWARRLARHRPGNRRMETSATGNRQGQAVPSIVPDMKTGDTVLLDTRSKDTKIDT